MTVNKTHDRRKLEAQAAVAKCAALAVENEELRAENVELRAEIKKLRDISADRDRAEWTALADL